MSVISDSAGEFIRKESVAKEAFRRLVSDACGDRKDIKLDDTLNRAKEVSKKRAIGFVDTNKPKDEK